MSQALSPSAEENQLVSDASAGVASSARDRCVDSAVLSAPLSVPVVADAGDPAELEPYAVVLSNARRLFQRVAASPTSSKQREYSLRVVLRHLY